MRRTRSEMPPFSEKIWGTRSDLLFISAQNRFCILKNLIHDPAGKTKLPGMWHGFFKITPSIGMQGEIFRMRFGKTLNVKQIRQSVTIRDSACFHSGNVCSSALFPERRKHAAPIRVLAHCLPAFH